MRKEFSRATKVQVIKRATRDYVTYCEKCGLPARRWQIDHMRADGLMGEPTLENAQLLGECCYKGKNAADAGAIALAKRQEAYHLGAKQKRRKPKDRTPYRPAAGKTRLQREWDL